MKTLRQVWKTSPKLRFAARTVAVAVAGYVVTAARTGFTDWKSLASGAATAGITALAGLVTPLEPFVGLNKAEVKVPSPPAEPTTLAKKPARRAKHAR